MKGKKMPNFVPTILEKTHDGERAFDIFSRLLRDRIVMLDGEVGEHSSSLIVSQLLYLNSENSTLPITLYINSPGGSVYHGLSITNTMSFIDAPVHTIVNGIAASMGAYILSCGEKGHRKAMPDATVMIHQVLSGYKGQATDIDIHAKETNRLKTLLTDNLAKNCDKTYTEVYEACERDNYMDAITARSFGLVDSIL